MATFMYAIRLQVAVIAGAIGRMTYQVSNDEKISISRIYQKSTGNFDITGISDSRGRLYSNAASGAGLDGNFFQDVESPNYANADLSTPIFLEGGNAIYLDVQDTSGAPNTIEFMLLGERTLGSQ